MEALIGTLAVAFTGLIGTILTTRSGYEKVMAELDKHNAVQDAKFEDLTREVREYKNYVTMVPVIEQRVNSLEATRLPAIEQRVTNIEKAAIK
jgi:hypothetical protein